MVWGLGFRVEVYGLGSRICVPEAARRSDGGSNRGGYNGGLLVPPYARSVPHIAQHARSTLRYSVPHVAEHARSTLRYVSAGHRVVEA
eukprot:3941914-Rhodomonas_salina.4